MSLKVSEIQARWVVYLIKNKIKLPSEQDMRQKILQHRVIFLFNCKSFNDENFE
jgi:hypothetical protein